MSKRYIFAFSLLLLQPRVESKLKLKGGEDLNSDAVPAQLQASVYSSEIGEATNEAATGEQKYHKAKLNAEEQNLIKYWQAIQQSKSGRDEKSSYDFVTQYSLSNAVVENVALGFGRGMGINIASAAYPVLKQLVEKVSYPIFHPIDAIRYARMSLFVANNERALTYKDLIFDQNKIDDAIKTHIIDPALESSKLARRVIDVQGGSDESVSSHYAFGIRIINEHLDNLSMNLGKALKLYEDCVKTEKTSSTSMLVTAGVEGCLAGIGYSFVKDLRFDFLSPIKSIQNGINSASVNNIVFKAAAGCSTLTLTAYILSKLSKCPYSSQELNGIIIQVNIVLNTIKAIKEQIKDIKDLNQIVAQKDVVIKLSKSLNNEIAALTFKIDPTKVNLKLIYDSKKMVGQQELV